MKYEMIPSKISRKLMDLFHGHSFYESQKFIGFRLKNTSCHSDRDRFVYQLFSKLIGKYIVIVDRLATAWVENTESKCNITICNPTSMYESHFKNFGSADPVILHRKKFLHIKGFKSISPLYGENYIEMLCHDILGSVFKFKVSYNNLLYLQFKEITKLEFDMVANLFNDDREDIQWKVTRFIPIESGKRKDKITIEKEEVIVNAKDEIEARHSLSNVLYVTRVEGN